MADLKQWGIADAEIEKMLGAAAGDDCFYLYPDNWQTFEVFWVVKDQWHVVVGLGGIFYQALRFAEVETAMRLLQVENQKQVFEDLLLMQAEIKSIFNSDI